MNPAGFLFGPTARLDVTGSFHATTADYIGFANGDRFYANKDAIGNTFSIADPSAFGFLTPTPNPVLIDQSFLQVPAGATLSLVGGDIDTFNPGLVASGGTINLFSVRGPDEIAFDGTHTGTGGGQITLTAAAVVASGAPAGSIRIVGGQFISDTSDLISANLGATDSTSRISIDTNSVNLAFTNIIAAASSAGRGPDIKIKTANLTTSDTNIVSTTSGTGQSGNIDIQAGRFFSEFSTIGTGTSATGRAGDVVVVSDKMELANATILTITEGPGQGGSIRVAAGLLVTDGVGTGVQTFSTGSGNAGNVLIEGGELRVIGGTQVASGAFGTGATGSVTVRMSGNVLLDTADPNFPSSIGTLRDPNTSGKAGDVTVQAANLTILNGSVVSAGVNGPFDPPTVRLDILGHLLIDAGSTGALTGILSSNPIPLGRGANIIVNAGSLTLLRGGSITADTFSNGNAGNITINVTSVLNIDGNFSQISSLTGSTDPDAGRAGDIRIQAGTLVVTNQGDIQSSATGIGRAGDISITAGSAHFVDGGNVLTTGINGITGNIDMAVSGQLTLNGGFIDSETASAGNAGNIRIAAGSLALLNGGRISTTAVRTDENGGITGNAGTITIEAGTVTLAGPAFISSSTFTSGNAGLVTVIAGDLAISGGASISTTSFDGSSGRAGDIFVTASGAITMTDFRSYIQSQSLGSNVAGNIVVNSGSLTILKDAAITTDTTTNFNAGTIMVNVAGQLLIDGTGHIDFVTGITSDAFGSVTNTGNAGSVTVTAGSIVLRNNAAISSNTNTSGNAGSVVVTASGPIVIDGSVHTLGTDFTGIASVANDTRDASETGDFIASSRAGSVTVATGGDLVLLRNGQIATDTYTNGDAGTITISVGGALVIDGNGQSKITGIFSDSFVGLGNAGTVNIAAGSGRLSNVSKIATETAADGRGGDIVATFGALQVDSGASISSTSSDKGNAGSVLVASSNGITLDGLGTTIQSRSLGTGNAGDIAINTGQLGIFNAAEITSSTTGSGAGGSVSIAAGFVTLGNAGRIAGETSGTGNGGTVSLQADSVDMFGGASISTTSFASGNAGNVRVAAGGAINMTGAGTTIQSRALGTGEAGPVLIIADQLVLKDNAAVTTEARVGGGGNITILVNQLLYLLSSSITTTVAGGSGSGGDIFIDPVFVVLNHSQILARAFAGNGGNITINAQHFLASIDSIVDASSTLGINGNISISNPSNDLTSGLAQLPGGLLSNQTLEQRACVAPGETPTLSLVPTGRGGLALVLDESQSQPAFLMAGRPSALATAATGIEQRQVAQFKALPMASPSTITCVH